MEECHHGCRGYARRRLRSSRANSRREGDKLIACIIRAIRAGSTDTNTEIRFSNERKEPRPSN